MFSHPEAEGHELVQYVRDPSCGLRAVIALHSTVRGPAFGGCRMWPYASEAEALCDALRLSRGMTCQGGDHGAAVWRRQDGGDRRSRTRQDASAPACPGRAPSSGCSGRYVIADDIGTTLDDLALMQQVTRHTAAATLAARAPLPVTAYGVLMAIRAAVLHRLGRADLAGLKVAVQGLGHVGLPLCGHLHDAGAALVVADLDPQRSAQAAARYGAQVVEPEAIFAQPVDLLAPCALGGVLDDRTIPRLQARLVAGGANNQLALARHDAMLAEHGILYVPDYIANAGGVIDFHQEQRDDRPEAVLAAVERIYDVTLDVLERAKAAGATPLTVADRLVAERLRPGQPAGPGDDTAAAALDSIFRLRHRLRRDCLGDPPCAWKDHATAAPCASRCARGIPIRSTSATARSAARPRAAAAMRSISAATTPASRWSAASMSGSIMRKMREPGEAASAEESPAERNFCGICASCLWLWDPRWPDLVHPLRLGDRQRRCLCRRSAPI